MQMVNVAELKSKLSVYLDYVRLGEEIIVSEHQRPIAKLVPLLPDDGIDAEELEMIAAGLARAPITPLTDSFWKMPAPRVTDADAIAAVRAERDED